MILGITSWQVCPVWQSYSLSLTCNISPNINPLITFKYRKIDEPEISMTFIPILSFSVTNHISVQTSRPRYPVPAAPVRKRFSPCIALFAASRCSGVSCSKWMGSSLCSSFWRTSRIPPVEHVVFFRRSCFVNFWNSTDSGNPAENKEINGPTHLTHLAVLWSPRKKVTSILFIIIYNTQESSNILSSCEAFSLHLLIYPTSC